MGSLPGDQAKHHEQLLQRQLTARSERRESPLNANSFQKFTIEMLAAGTLPTLPV